MRQDRGCDLHHVEHGRLSLSHGKTPDGIAVEPGLDERMDTSFPEIGIDAPLHDPKQGLARLGARGKSGLAAARPAERQIERGVRLFTRCRKRRALVEHHLNVGAEQALDFDGALGSQRNTFAVKMGLKGDALLLDATEFRERHDLIPAGIGENRLLPMHEAVEAAELGDALGTRAKHQVISVGEDDIGAGRRHVLGKHGLYRGPGADRHEGRRSHRPARTRDETNPRGPVPRPNRKGESVRHGAL